MARERVGTISFWINDDRDIDFNQSIDLSFPLFLNEEDMEDDIVDIEQLINYIKNFLKAMGYSDVTIDKFFRDEEYEVV